MHKSLLRTFEYTVLRKLFPRHDHTDFSPRRWRDGASIFRFLFAATTGTAWLLLIFFATVLAVVDLLAEDEVEVFEESAATGLPMIGTAPTVDEDAVPFLSGDSESPSVHFRFRAASKPLSLSFVGAGVVAEVAGAAGGKERGDASEGTVPPGWDDAVTAREPRLLGGDRLLVLRLRILRGGGGGTDVDVVGIAGSTTATIGRRGLDGVKTKTRQKINLIWKKCFTANFILFKERNYAVLERALFTDKDHHCRVTDIILSNSTISSKMKNMLLEDHFNIKQRTTFRHGFFSWRCHFEIRTQYGRCSFLIRT